MLEMNIYQSEFVRDEHYPTEILSKMNIYI